MAVLKLSANGAYQWHTFYGSNAYDDIPSDAAFDLSNHILISGYSDASWNGDGGIGPLHAHSGGMDMTVLNSAALARINGIRSMDPANLTLVMP